ncbi:predicted protein [Verticillium alfalfae VaMs.102]|uniref:Predicted protein n=1 Tax=Verticillium alfalfae (strain VaMs.102 / ATCC MYA-4576 / FGSC 10136) TaxID=526221 RepID=C9SLK8_VERA1|nr:predicted protein [Verticillium alfalfae VaMs.102]EEY19576.1 predicted protein [Verticillium alfalfae VaMs.102]
MSAYALLYCTVRYGLKNEKDRLLTTKGSTGGSCGIYGNASKAAARNGHRAIVKLFIATNVDVDAISDRYVIAVATATAQDHIEIMRELLTAGANIRRQVRFGWLSGDRRTGPLFVAALNGSVDAVKAALEHGILDYWRLKPSSGSECPYSRHIRWQLRRGSGASSTPRRGKKQSRRF